MIPTWTYVKSDDGIFVNLYIGSSINIGKVAGTDVEIVQKTDYPWKGEVSITINPDRSENFTVHLRVPNRETSDLYKPVPEVNSIRSLAVNGEAVTVNPVNGYIPITREWEKGDKIDLVLPMAVQQLTADERIEADRNMVALRFGPLIYNVEKVDDQDLNKTIGNDPLITEWRPDMFGGIMTIKGKWADGSQLLAVPNYVRLNREKMSPVEVRRFEDPRTVEPTYSVWIRK